MYRSTIASAFYHLCKGLNNYPPSTIQRACPAVRNFATKRSDDEIKLLKVAKDVSIEDNTNQPTFDDSQVLAADYFDKDGNQVFRVDYSKPIETIDWGAFEKAFGLDSQNDHEIDLNDIEGLTVTEFVDEEDQFAPNNSVGTPTGLSGVASRDPHLIMPTKVEKFIKETHAESDNPTEEVEDDLEIFASNDSMNWGVTKRRSRDSKQIESTRNMSKKLSSSDKKRRSQQKLAQAINRKSVEATVANVLEAPTNYKRPGFERRVRSLEAEMERIVVKRLELNEIWGKRNASVQSILLSPNLQNLTIYYETEDQSRIKNLKKVTRDLRSTIASSITLKYAPNVFLEYSAHNTACNNSNELDDLFRKIAEERTIGADVSNSTSTKLL